jgi:hypothetical protein
MKWTHHQLSIMAAARKPSSTNLTLATSSPSHSPRQLAFRRCCAELANGGLSAVSTSRLLHGPPVSQNSFSHHWTQESFGILVIDLAPAAFAGVQQFVM